MKSTKTFLILTVFVLTMGSIMAYGQQAGERRPSREKWEEVAIQARIEAIDWETRMVTLRGPEGNLVTVKADETVKRFNEINTGDLVNAAFYTYIKAEFRDPTPEEMREPLVIVTDEVRATTEIPPAAGATKIVKAVVTVEIVNRPDMVVTVKGPKGNFVTIPVEDEALISQLHVGEVTILTYAEATTLSLEKVKVGE